MAEIILSLVTEAVFSKSISLASVGFSRVCGVGKGLEDLAGKIELIEALLSDAGKKESSSRAVQIWLRKLESVANEANILLDSIAYETLREGIEKRKRLKVSAYFKTSSNPIVFRFRVGSKIMKINLALDNVYKESIGLGILAIDNGRINSDRRNQLLTHPYLDDSEIVGRRDEMERIVEMLCSSEESDFPVIGIVGMAGKGKTALAQLIYTNGKVINCFEKRIWVCVSDQFKLDNILNEMLQSLTGRNFLLTNMEAILKKLKDELSGKRFLLVPDDVWNEDSLLWASLKECLGKVGGLKGSRMIITTRSEKVISVVEGQSYQLGLLSKEHSWDLFEKIAFGVGGAPKSSKLVDIGCKIVERCGGIPLAIKAVGGLLYSKKNESEWLEVEGSKTWISMDTLGRVQSAIKLSYDHLPLSIKQCFAVCSIYDKDSVLKKEELVQLWMAQGLLNPPRGSQWDMENIGKNYFDTLLQRSLFHDAEFNDYGFIVSCRMHDLVHDFAVQVSKSYCLKLEDGLLMNNDIKVTHLSISSQKKEMVKLPKGNLRNLRTLFVNDSIFGCIKLMDYKYLHVLVVADWGVKDLPNSIGKLKHLGYLDISRTNVVKLPEQITKLYQLQTLRANNLSKLPEDLGNLMNLRHIYLSKGSFLLSDIRKLTSLRTLSCIKLDEGEKRKMEDFGGLQHLAGEVKIFGLENVSSQEEAMKAKLSEKQNIDLLELHWHQRRAGEECNDEKVFESLKPPSLLRVIRIFGFSSQNLPSWMFVQPQHLHNLVAIKFENLQNCKHIPPLGHLPYLKSLEIRKMKSLRRIGSEFYGISFLENATGSSQNDIATYTFVVFPSLKRLQFYDISELKYWSDPVQHQSSYGIKLLPNLEELVFFSCPKLMEVPKQLSNLFSLRHLCIFANDCELVSLHDISGLVALQYLDILYCKRLSNLPPGLEKCTSLQTLYLPINDVSWVESIRCLTNLKDLSLRLKLELYTECFPWPSILDQEMHNFGALEFLELEGNSNVKSLPDQIQHLSALRVLCLKDFGSLIAIPEWLGNIHSLRCLKLWSSQMIAYLPSAEAMKHLTNLEISNSCIVLIERCKIGGPEWHKIKHIPHIHLDLAYSTKG